MGFEPVGQLPMGQLPMGQRLRVSNDFENRKIHRRKFSTLKNFNVGNTVHVFQHARKSSPRFAARAKKQSTLFSTRENCFRLVWIVGFFAFFVFVSWGL